MANSVILKIDRTRPTLLLYLDDIIVDATEGNRKCLLCSFEINERWTFRIEEFICQKHTTQYDGLETCSWRIVFVEKPQRCQPVL